MTLHSHQLRATLLAAGIPFAAIVEPSDASYKPCESGWLLDDFHGWYFRALEAFGIREWTAESWDCDDFTDLFCALARIAHRRTPEGKGHGLPVGRLNFLQVPGAPHGPQQKKHAIVWACTSDKGLIFIEPQTLHRELKLTIPQLNSATRCSD